MRLCTGRISIPSLRFCRSSFAYVLGGQRPALGKLWVDKGADKRCLSRFGIRPTLFGLGGKPIKSGPLDAAEPKDNVPSPKDCAAPQTLSLGSAVANGAGGAAARPNPRPVRRVPAPSFGLRAHFPTSLRDEPARELPGLTDLPKCR